MIARFEVEFKGHSWHHIEDYLITFFFLSQNGKENLPSPNYNCLYIHTTVGVENI